MRETTCGNRGEPRFGLSRPAFGLPVVDSPRALSPVAPEPVFNVPAAVLSVLFALIAIHGVRLWLSPETDASIVARLSFVPMDLTALVDPDELVRRSLVPSGSPFSVGPTLLTYALLHGGWTHLGLNATWLLAFGSPVARRFGSRRFLVFLATAAVAGALAQWALFPFSDNPLVGASAAVSGCMGAAVRFAFSSSHAKGPAVTPSPALSLAATVRDRRTLSFLLAWLVSNFVFGAGSVSFGFSDQPVAWQAHVGGFLVGLLLFSWFDPAPQADASPV